MTEYYQDDKTTIHHGDCLEVMADMPAESIDAIVTDPPYGLGFMGREWDALPPGREWAEECLRVLKPGGHLLAFGGSRTWHRLAVAIEDGGFEMRDSIAWLYGAGFPKSLDVSKAIDKGGAVSRSRALEFTEWMRSTGITSSQINEATATNMGGHYLTGQSQPAIATADLFDKLRPLLPEVPERIERLVAERTGIEWTDYVKREVTGKNKWTNSANHFVPGEDHTQRVHTDITAPATPESQQWQGWGTALKPAFEPVVVARKPLIGTVAANVLEHGTGAINVDGCRVEGQPRTTHKDGNRVGNRDGASSYVIGPEGAAYQGASGRWPANVVLDESQAEALDEQSGITVSRRAARGDGKGETGVYGEYGNLDDDTRGHNDSGGASRFFYVAKAPKRERPNVDGTAHPTVKPLSLMQWLVRLVTPPGGTVLDPFAGSGTTIEAALTEGFNSIGIELTDEYLPLIQHRIERATQQAFNI